MQLPRHFTVKEVREVLMLRIESAEEEFNELSDALKKANEGTVVTGWFGYQKRVFPDEWLVLRRYGLPLGEARVFLNSLKEKDEALSKYPEDSRVALSVEETNTLFPLKED